MAQSRFIAHDPNKKAFHRNRRVVYTFGGDGRFYLFCTCRQTGLLLRAYPLAHFTIHNIITQVAEYIGTV